MEDIAEIRELIAIVSTDRREMLLFIVEYMHTMLLLENALVAVNHTVKTMRQDEELEVPQTPEAWQEVAQSFEEWWNFPRIIGAIDGKHIRLRNTPQGGRHYFNYKKFYSMVLLAIADASYKFLYVNMGAIGSESDGGVFAQT
ncbi:uncharacterized protein LOC135218892 [Macrobrachium nipponense]|uniref:uncharacterized protein LOC135218892 n=1 Tax=Macrobrachium nipponense TaxID=159736 RepID=UPI0030C7F930